jgi:hypothetical protein
MMPVTIAIEALVINQQRCGEVIWLTPTCIYAMPFSAGLGSASRDIKQLIATPRKLVVVTLGNDQYNVKIVRTNSQPSNPTNSNKDSFFYWVSRIPQKFIKLVKDPLRTNPRNLSDTVIK